MELGARSTSAASVARGASLLRREGIAVRLKIGRFGFSRAFDVEQRERAAEEFGASPEVVSARKTILDRRSDAVRAISAVLADAQNYWRSMTIQWPEPGVRIMRREKVSEFNTRMDQFLDELQNAVVAADAVYQSELLPAAREKLGELFDASDYPTTLVGQWGLAHEYISIEPPEYLKDLAPDIYEQERARVAAKFEEAVSLAEQAFADEFSKVVAGLVDRLTPREVVEWESSIKGDVLAVLSQAVIGQESGDEYERHKLATAKKIETFGASLRIVDANDKRSTRTFETDEGVSEYLRGMACVITGRHVEEKTFRDSAVGNLTEFFERFRSLSVGSNEQLDALVTQAQEALAGRSASEIRAGGESRNVVRESLAAISERLEELAINRPRRAIALDDAE
jgi:hypothetical protein